MEAPSPAPSPILSAASAAALELPSFLAVLAHLAASDLGRDRILALAPAADEGELGRRRRRFEEASRLVSAASGAGGVSGAGALVPDFEVPIAALLSGIETGRPPLEGIDLVHLADVLKASRAAKARIAAADPPAPELGALAAALPDLGELLRRIDRTLDRRGEVREDASPLLASLRGQIRRVRDQLYRELGEFVSQHKDELSEETIPMRGGRLVLVQQAGSRGRSPGLVHGRSATGKSFYFEPLGVVESNNTLQQSVEDEEAERRRILAELIALARQALGDIHEHAAFLGELDLQQAAARFAEVAQGRLAEVAPRGELRLRAARHPLLDPRLADLRGAALGQAGHGGEIMPLDLEFHPDRRILVVTGPNAGGKTVSLKTVGLLALVAQCGLPIPAAAGSRVPCLARLVATVGDEQDLLADRSTFSGRLLRLKEAWEEAGPDSLVLLDELGSGTDPEEGAALAVALLEGLLERGSLGVITTHLTQLAAAALQLPGATCAAMEFDPRTGRPTFRLVPGPPGGSEALALGRRLGLPGEWLDRAEARLGTEHRELRRLIAEVETVRTELAQARDRLEVEASDAEKLRRRLADERAALEDERKSVGRRLQGEVDAFRREVRDRLRAEVERLREEVAGGRRRGLEADAVERLFAEAPELPRDEPETAGTLAVGAPARHARLGWQGIVEKLEPGRAEVLVRGKRVRCRPDDLVPVAAGAPAAASRAEGPSGLRRTRGPRPGEQATADPRGEPMEGVDVPIEINLIGRRVEPALEELDVYLDRALLAARKEVRVIHGHGTGRLRDAVREHLRAHPAIAALRAGAANEGGNGATVATLRGA
ncbi:MAG TPA: Smr/MutS family protein [Thermoanaerobaculia bacterium]|jgi:DNA mismatch repair protein MutS2